MSKKPAKIIRRQNPTLQKKTDFKNYFANQNYYAYTLHTLINKHEHKERNTNKWNKTIIMFPKSCQNNQHNMINIFKLIDMLIPEFF